ncbi:MAG TPA: hypothetical protein VKF59_09790 [Candidatus Dormibacteraeota bacterium]|nr:hypothetical protein [Candidatus Dormibacteraeota bacterium]
MSGREDASALTSTRVEVDPEPDAFLDAMEARGWGDGLPLVPPTPERVAAAVAASGRPPGEVVAVLPPSLAAATVEKVAVNAVLAGCRPAYLPVVLAAIRAAAQEPFNLPAIQATTHPCAVLTLVSGPIARQLGMNWGYGAFGPGHRANATIGRAVRLVLMNVGGARPGTLDRATQGTPAKYTYCAAENEEDSPWPPLRVSLGFGADQSIVTVIAGEAPHNINDHGSADAAGLLLQMAGTLATPGSNNVYMKGDGYLFLGPEHARQLAAHGLSREDVQAWLFEHAVVPHERMGAGQLRHIQHGLTEEERRLAGQAQRLGRDPGAIRIAVVGGDGRHSCWVPTFGMTQSCSEVVR